MTIRALKRGKAKNILAAAIDSALLAVKIYNKPRATFRTEAFISLMIIAWTYSIVISIRLWAIDSILKRKILHAIKKLTEK